MNRIREVCLIDDDLIVAFLMKKYLNKTGIVESISIYGNGKEGFVEMEKRWKEKIPFPDIIFLDLNMPIWDGWIFYEEFSKLSGSAHTQVLILTSSLSEIDINKAKSLGLGEKFFTKPMTYTLLNTILSNFNNK